MLLNILEKAGRNKPTYLILSNTDKKGHEIFIKWYVFILCP